MGRRFVHQRDSVTTGQNAWKFALVLLPVLLCACQKYQLLVDDAPYQVIPESLKHELDAAVRSELKDVETTPEFQLTKYASAAEPPRLKDRRVLDPWDMTLQEVIFQSLSNSKVIRSGGQFLSPNNALLRSPESVPTVYDQAIQSTGVLFGQRGVQAALSEFDAQFTTRMLWGNSSLLQNSRNTGIPAGTVLNEDSAQFQTSLQRALFSGGQFGLSHSWNYTSNNNTAGRLFPSVYEGNLRAEFRQPLLAGAGYKYSQIAGPISENIQGVTGVQQGILIARLNGQMTEFDFEMNVVGFVRDIEMQYWKLHLAYERHAILQRSFDDAQRILRLLEARIDSPGSDLALIVEAREGVLTTERNVLEALDEIYTNESQLRLMMGCMLQSEKTIHPIDKPVTAEVTHDWHGVLQTALDRRPELRRQKAAIHSAELQLFAAENLNRPRFDLLASGQTNGLGDNLFGSRETDGTDQRIGNAYDRLMRFNQTGWNLGVEYSQPLGLRFARKQVENHELRLRKARAVLEEQEAEVLAELTHAFQTVERTFILMQRQQSLVENAEDRVSAAEANYNSNKDGRGYLDLDGLNRARDLLAEAVTRQRESEIEYNMALTDIEFRCGRLLNQHNVILNESPEYAMSVQIAALPAMAPAGEAEIPLTPPSLPSKHPAETRPSEVPLSDPQIETQPIEQKTNPDTRANIFRSQPAISQAPRSSASDRLKSPTALLQPSKPVPLTPPAASAPSDIGTVQSQWKASKRIVQSTTRAAEPGPGSEASLPLLDAGFTAPLLLPPRSDADVNASTP